LLLEGVRLEEFKEAVKRRITLQETKIAISLEEVSGEEGRNECS
jgi:hypothetical protein